MIGFVGKQSYFGDYKMKQHYIDEKQVSAILCKATIIWQTVYRLQNITEYRRMGAAALIVISNSAAKCFILAC
ncbi:hypothetical protein B5E67_06355 [Faecalibacterium sp. An122]|jgi:hypothetical protein|nr:hypothetical protein B5E67_06355 [Faecalibacterium sp. An122]